MKKELDINKYLNHQNIGIFDKVSNKYNIKLFLDSSLNSWLVDNNQVIWTPKDNLNIASFTHELLHIYLDYLGICSKKFIFKELFCVDVLISLNRGLFDHVYNVSSHKKMYPYFREIGFKDEEFVQSTGPFVKKIDFFIIKLFKKLNIFPKLWISQYIGHFFSLKNDVRADYNKYNRMFLCKLARLDPSLYQIIYSFDSNWAKQTIYYCEENYKQLSDGLYYWLKKKKIIKSRLKYIPL